MRITNLLMLLFVALFYSCTQFLEEEETGKLAYTGDDGCIFCHTNEERLKVLAPPEEDDGHSGGGG